MNPLSETLEAATNYVDEGSDNEENSGRTFSRTQKMAVKFLLNNISAGVIIGRGGTNITELQQHSGARIQLSRNNEFYPGTNDRVMLISGTVKSVLTALYLILTKLANARKNGQSGERTRLEDDVEGLASVLKLVMPTACCGAIMGKGGKTVKQFVKDSGASITVLPQTYMSQDMDNRIISISGELEQILRAVAHIVAKVAGDPQYINNVSLSVSYMRSGYQQQGAYAGYSDEMQTPYGGNGVNVTSVHPMAFPHPSSYHPENPHGTSYADTAAASDSPPSTELPGSPSSHMAQMAMPMAPMGVPMAIDGRGPRIEMSISVPDDKIGAIIGKGGDIITQLQTLVGVKIIISSRNEFEPGTRNRRVTVIGPPEAVQIACMLISMKERSMYFTPSPAMFGGAPYGWVMPTPWANAPPSPPLADSNTYQ